MNVLNLPRNPWNNKYSSCLRNGSIINYLKSLNINKTIAVPLSDGYNHNNLNEFQGFDSDIIIGALCSIGDIPIKNKVVYLPLDDEIFSYGLKYVLEKDLKGKVPPTWDNKLPIVFWRGAVNNSMNLRKEVVKLLYNYEHSNVKFIITPWSSPGDWGKIEWTENEIKYYDRDVIIPVESSWEVKARPYSIYDHMCHKYLIITDGFVIASNLQWIFGSGSVPILVTNKDNLYWFKKYLKPYSFDTNNLHEGMCIELNDETKLRETVSWLIEHDDIAKIIAENSVRFSEIIFSSDFQKKYILEQIL